MAQTLSPQKTFLARQLLVAMDEGVAELVAHLVATEGLTPAAAKERALAALKAECERHAAHDAFLAELEAGEATTAGTPAELEDGTVVETVGTVRRKLGGW